MGPLQSHLIFWGDLLKIIFLGEKLEKTNREEIPAGSEYSKQTIYFIGFTFYLMSISVKYAYIHKYSCKVKTEEAFLTLYFLIVIFSLINQI